MVFQKPLRLFIPPGRVSGPGFPPGLGKKSLTFQQLTSILPIVTKALQDCDVRGADRV
jgi:hypothetical protein